MKDSGNDQSEGLEPSQNAADQTAPQGSQIKNDLFPEFCITLLAIHLIEKSPRRVRRALEKQIDALVHAIEKFGFRVPILVRHKQGGEHYQVVDGHVRLEAALRLGAEQLPCIVVDDLSDLELRRLKLSLNKLQESGAWNEAELKLEIDELIEIDSDFVIPGFELAEIEAIHFGQADSESADPADDISGFLSEKACVSRPGDVWQLGDHILVCSSARDGGVLALALDGQVASCIFTDPPYNLRVSGVVRSAASGFAEFYEASGEMSRAEFTVFLAQTLGNAAQCLKPGGVFFACIDHRHVGEMAEALETIGLERLDICVWVKSAPGMGGLYRSQHELVFVARKRGERHKNNVELGKHGRNRSNVWSYAGSTGGQCDPDDDYQNHPTPKPIRMVMDALLDVSAPGDIVLDPFLGSGTTLLAAERTGRRCVGVEIEPRYVDLAIRRWQEMTGHRSIQAKTGKTFEELAVLRGEDDGTYAADESRDGREVS